ncbi:MAG: c-type cytochrome biogenesis protein CcmI [Gammaproteobacteria bacterium]
MSFLIAAILLLICVLAPLVWITLRHRPQAHKPTALHARLEAELRDDVTAGVLPAEDLEQAARDIEADDRETAPLHRTSGKRWAIALMVLVVVVAGVLYWQQGNWRAGIQGDRVAVMHRVHSMLQELQTHLKTHPKDMHAWVTLGQAKSAMGDYAAAAAAYGHAVKLDHEQDPDLLGAWGEAQVLADPQHPTAQERAIFAAVLKADPGNIRGLWYGGLLAQANGHNALAAQRWRHLLAQPIPAPMAELIRTRLQAMNAATSALPAVAASGAAAATLTAPRIAIEVKLSPGLAKRFKPGETLFVLARNPNGGPPLAVRRINVKNFPLHVELSDADAMLTGHNLSHAEGVVEIQARLSPGGNAMDTKGVLLGTQRITPKSGTQHVTLVIDRPAGPVAKDQ